jgi:SAM-dependent methyltransferase
MHARETFDTVAALYEAQRAGYPSALFDDLIEYAGLTGGDRVLEIGCGSGQATTGFLAHGLDVVAVDPGKALIGIARAKFADDDRVRFEVARFEDWRPEGRQFHLVASAQAWHWVPPEIAFRAAFQVLHHEGALAVFGHTPRPSAAITEALEPAYRLHAPEVWGPPVESWYLPEGPVPKLFDASGLFGPVTHRNYRWSRRFTPEPFCAYLGTRSDHVQLPADRRASLLSEIERALPGEIEVGWETNLYLAKARRA